MDVCAEEVNVALFPQALKKADKQMLEPLMNLEITVGESHLGAVLGDLAQRRGNIQEIQSRQDNKVVIASVPLAEMMVCVHVQIYKLPRMKAH